MRKLFLILLCIPLLAAQQALPTEGVKWMFNAGDSILASPTIRNGVIFLGSVNGSLYAINPMNGQPIWTYGPAEKIQSSPAVSDEMVFFGSNDGYMYALWLNGTLAWKFKTDNKILSTPLLAYDLLYFNSADGSLYSVYPESGNVLWKYSEESPFASSPIASNWMIYVGSDDGTLYAFNAFNGTIVWKQKYPNKIQSSFAISPKNILYFTCKDGNAYAVYAADGSKFWNISTGTESQSSVYYNDRSGFSYFGTSDDNLYAVDSKGTLVWRFETRNWVIATPLGYRGIVYAGSYDGNLYAISTIRIRFPSTEMNVTGSQVPVSGEAYADAGIKYVQVRFNDGAWQDVNGTEKWSYMWDTSSFKDDVYTFEARGTDDLGNVEPPPYSNLLVKFARNIPEKGLTVSYQQVILAGMSMRFEVNDTEGNPVPHPELTIFGRTYTGDENGVVASDENGNPLKSDAEGDFNFTVRKIGYSTKYLSIKVVKVVDIIPYVIGVLVGLVVLAFIIYRLVRNLLRRMKKQ